MSEPTAEPQPSTPFPQEALVSPAAPADPLAGDWSEGMPGPVRALGIPAPRLLTAEGTAQEPEVALPAAAPPDEEEGTVEAPDAWSVAADDPLHSVPPPAAPEERAHGSTLESAFAAASSQHAEVAALAELPAGEGVIELPAEEGVVELPAAEALDAHDGEILEAEPLEPVAAAAPPDSEAATEPRDEAGAWPQAIAAHADPQNGATPSSDAALAEAGQHAAVQEVWQPATSSEAAASPSDAAWAGATPADAQPIWSSAPAAEAPPAWDALAAAPEPSGSSIGWGAAAPAATPADWSAVSSSPDWSAPANAAASDHGGWDARPPAAAESTWTQGAPAAPVADWSGPAAAAPAPAAHGSGQNGSAPSTMEQMLSEEHEPPPPEPNAALFAPLAAGESLSDEETVFVDEDPDLPVPVEEPPRAPLAQIEPVAASALSVQGEHRVAVHTRGGRTLRGSVRDIDLSKSQFSLLPQGGANPEAIYHSEVKAIFFMLPPGERPRPASGGKVRVIFADGRSIDGNRDGGEGKHGFFLVPTDSARTNTRRIYVARDAITDLKDG